MRKNDEIDRLQAKLWFDHVRHRLGLPRSASPYKVEQTIRRLRNQEEFEITGRWAKYAGGTKPSASLVKLVDTLISENGQPEDSGRVLNHPLGEVLRRGKDAANNEVLSRLAIAIQEIVFSRKSLDRPRRKVNSRLLAKLVSHASLDALTCLIILLHEAILEGNADVVVDIGISIHDVLLMLYATDYFALTQLDLLDIFETRVFSLIREGDTGICIHADFFDLVTRLRSGLSSQFKNFGRDPSPDEKLKVVHAIINRNMGAVRFNPEWIALKRFNLSEPPQPISQRVLKTLTSCH